MKKIIFAAVAVFCIALAPTTFAAMDDVVYTLAVNGTTNSASAGYVVRGIVQGVYVNGPAAGVNATGVVLVTSADGQTILTKTQSSDTYYPVRAQINNTSGTAISDSGVGFTNVVYAPIAVGSLLTARVAGTSADTNATTWTIRVLVDQ